MTKIPECLEGTCMLRGMEKLLEYLEQEEEERDKRNEESLTLKMRSAYWSKLTQEQMNRWRIYGTMTMAQPEQRTLNNVASAITRKKYVRKIILAGLQKDQAQKDPMTQRIWTSRMTQVKKWIDQKELQLPVTWTTQTEVKERLKAQQEEDEMRVIRHLATRETDQSIPSKSITDWHLTRSKTREILQHLAENRKLQTTFSNLIGATRFKTVKEGKLRAAVCL